MTQEKHELIPYEGNSISLFSDDRDTYINLTEMAKAWKDKRKAIKSWLKNTRTLDFLKVWEQKHNPNFNGAQMGTVLEKAGDMDTSLSIQYYIEQTHAIGIFTRSGGHGGTYAHMDIAIKFAGWLSAEFELFLIEEVQRLKKLDRDKNSYDLLTHDQVLALVQLKEVFKYVVNQDAAHNAHKDVFSSNSSAANPFAEFNKMRNEMLDISKQKIEERILNYCKENKIASAKKNNEFAKKRTNFNTR